MHMYFINSIFHSCTKAKRWFSCCGSQERISVPRSSGTCSTVVSLAAVFGGALRDIQKMATRETSSTVDQ